LHLAPTGNAEKRGSSMVNNIMISDPIITHNDHANLGRDSSCGKSNSVLSQINGMAMRSALATVAI